MGAEAEVIAEVVKLLIMLAFQQAQTAGLSAEEFEKVYLRERLKFLESDPKKIPEV